MNIKHACRTYLLLATLAAVAATSLPAYFASKSALTAQCLRHLQSAASIQGNRVSALMRQNEERLALVCSRTQLRLSLRSYLEGGKREDQETMGKILADARASVPTFQKIEVLTTDGVVVGSTDPRGLGQPFAGGGSWLAAKSRPVVGTFQKAGPDLIELLAGPLVLESRTIGELVITASAAEYAKLVGDYSGLGATGETLLLRPKETGEAVSLMPTRHDPDAAFRRALPTGHAGLLPASGSQPTGAPEPRTGTDYRGKAVLAAGTWLAADNIGVLVKMDADEALAPVARLRHMLLLGVLVAGAVGALLALRLSDGLAAPVARLTSFAKAMSGDEPFARAPDANIDELNVLSHTFSDMSARLIEKNAELERKLGELSRERQKIERLTDSIGTGVAIIDRSFQTLWANGVIRRLFGDSVVGATCYRAFNQRDEVCPGCGVATILRTGAKEACHEQRGLDVNGNTIWSWIVATPLYDADGNIDSVLEVVVPITERKKAEEENVRLIEELKAALGQVRKLSGLLPICASCKKIRDDKGYWNRIESYIKEHSEAQFTHSICPQCAEKLYPEYNTKQEG